MYNLCKALSVCFLAIFVIGKIEANGNDTEHERLLLQFLKTKITTNSAPISIKDNTGILILTLASFKGDPF